MFIVFSAEQFCTSNVYCGADCTLLTCAHGGPCVRKPGHDGDHACQRCCDDARRLPPPSPLEELWAAGMLPALPPLSLPPAWLAPTLIPPVPALLNRFSAVVSAPHAASQPAAKHIKSPRPCISVNVGRDLSTHKPPPAQYGECCHIVTLLCNYAIAPPGMDLRVHGVWPMRRRRGNQKK